MYVLIGHQLKRLILFVAVVVLHIRLRTDVLGVSQHNFRKRTMSKTILPSQLPVLSKNLYFFNVQHYALKVRSH